MAVVYLIIIGIITVILLIGLLILSTYNSFIRARLRTSEAWSAIEVQIKRRASLVPNLVETVKGYAGHERETLENVIRARGALTSAKGAAEAAMADNMLTGALGRLFAVVEAYPQLKASENFASLQKDLFDVEEKIAYARQFYNRNVLEYNTRIHIFPNSVIAGVFGFKPAEFFEAKLPEEEVKVGFGSRA